MAEGAPNILVVDGKRDERALIAAVLREAGFSAVEAAEASAAWPAMNRAKFAAAVVALPDGEAGEFLRQARCRQPGLRAIVVVGPATLPLADEDCDPVLRRPLAPRQLLGSVFDLVLRDGEHETGAPRGPAAELGIAAAELACLDSRRVAAAAAGASRLADDLTRRIVETKTLCRGLAGVMTIGALAPAGGAAD